MTQRTVAPETIETPRLLLRRPRPGDAEAIFTRDSADPEVTRYVGWPAHKSVEDTRGFLAFSDGHWQQWPAGAYLAWSCQDGRLPGSTGLLFETPLRAMTGYVFARDAWGRGYATEALAAMVDVARAAGVLRLFALCHAAHRPSFPTKLRVLETCGFSLEGTLRRYVEFPSLKPGDPQDVLCYATILEIASGTQRENCS
jgi:RimJ/RimL family protein N-acetyltransferase